MSKWNAIVSGRRAWAALRDLSRRWCLGVGSGLSRRVAANGASAGACRARQIIAERPADAARIGARLQLDGDHIRISTPRNCTCKIPLPIPCRGVFSAASARKIPLPDDRQIKPVECVIYLIRVDLSATRATNFAPRCDAFGGLSLTAGNCREFRRRRGAANCVDGGNPGAARPGDFGRLPAARRLTAVAKEGAQQLAGALLLEAAVDFGLVVGGRLLEQPRPVLDRPALWVVGAEIEPAQAGKADRRGAHRARFEGNRQDRQRGANGAVAGIREALCQVRPAIDSAGETASRAAVASVLFGAFGTAADGAARLQSVVLPVCRAVAGRGGVGRHGVHQEPRAADRRRHRRAVHGGGAEPEAGQALLSDDHFSADGTLIEAWASMKSFRPKDGSGDPPAPGRNRERDFHGEKRRTETHASTTDPDARLYRKGRGQPAKLAYLGHVLLENRHAMVVDARLTLATGTAEREAGLEVIAARPGNHRITLGADKAYDVASFVADLRAYNVTPHVAQNTTNRRSANRRSDDPPSRLCGQRAGPQTHRGGVWLGQGCRRLRQDPSPWPSPCRLDVHVDGYCLQPRPPA